MFKKLIALSLLLVLAFSMFGCTTASPKRGAVTDGIYKNEFFELSYTIPEGWRALTDEEYKERFYYSLPTNEELAEFDSEFEDVLIVKTENEAYYISISYSKLFPKGTSDEQVKKMISLKERDSNFGFVEYILIEDVKYGYILTPSQDGSHTIYYCWSTQMQGKFRQLYKFVLPNDELFENMLSGFSFIKTA